MTKHLLTRKHLLTLILALFLGGETAWAYAPDFSKTCSTGQTLYYAIIDATNHYVALTSPGGTSSSWNNNGWNNYTKPTGNITLPTTVSYNNVTYTVTKIGTGAFWDCTGLTGTLTIPNTTVSIDDDAFCNCGFTSLHIGSALEEFY